MKIISVKETNNSFHGLWGKTKTEYIHTTGKYSFHEAEALQYHPFLNESNDSINKKIKSKFFDIILPINDGTANKRRSRKAILAQPLSFTKEEFQNYKHFYGKNLPEKFKMIETELTNLSLEHYKNSGFMYTFKKWLHNIVKF